MEPASSVLVLPFLFLFGGFSLPLGLPPLPEDPAISRTAPEECLAYVSWAGTATPDAKSANQTERLLAEPEVQTLLSAVDSAVLAGIKKNTHDDDGTKDIYPLVKTLLMRPGAVFLSKASFGPQGVRLGPPVEADPGVFQSTASARLTFLRAVRFSIWGRSRRPWAKRSSAWKNSCRRALSRRWRLRGRRSAASSRGRRCR